MAEALGPELPGRGAARQQALHPRRDVRIEGSEAVDVDRLLASILDAERVAAAPHNSCQLARAAAAVVEAVAIGVDVALLEEHNRVELALVARHEVLLDVSAREGDAVVAERARHPVGREAVRAIEHTGGVVLLDREADREIVVTSRADVGQHGHRCVLDCRRAVGQLVVVRHILHRRAWVEDRADLAQIAESDEPVLVALRLQLAAQLDEALLRGEELEAEDFLLVLVACQLADESATLLGDVRSNVEQRPERVVHLLQLHRDVRVDDADVLLDAIDAPQDDEQHGDVLPEHLLRTYHQRVQSIRSVMSARRAGDERPMGA
eukprot:5696148-Prymnesium_polylepis.2